MMPPHSVMELEERLTAAGSALSQPPSSLDELLRLLDRIEELLSKVEQSPAKSMLTTLSPLMDAFISEDFLKHSDVDVKVGVASCISEITRITAPEAPYDDEKMKDVFHLIVSSFEDLWDASSRSHHKRASILETVAKVRSCVLMLDLECDQMIIEMFQNFLKAIRVHHSEIIFASMETVMTLVIEESEDISSDLLNPILDTLKRNNKEVIPIAKKLAEKVIQNCAQKLRPSLTQALKTLDTNFGDYSEVVASSCDPNASIVGHHISKYQKVAKEGSAETPVLDKDTSVGRSPKSVSSINETVTEETIPDAPHSNMADSSQHVEDKSMLKNVSNDLGVRKPEILGLKKASAKRKGRQSKPKNNLAVSSDLLNDQKQAEHVPCHQETAAKDGSSDEILAVEDDISLDNVNDIHPPQLKVPEKVDVNLASSIQSPDIPADSQAKKAGRSKRKENLGTEETSYGDCAFKKALEGTDVLKPKQHCHSLKKKSDKTIDKDKVLTEEVLSKNDRLSTSDSEAISLDPTKILGDVSNKVGDGSSLSKKEGKKGGQKKPEILKLSSKEDHGQDTVGSPRTPLKSSKNEDNLEGTKRTSNKRNRSPDTEKASETEEYREELVGSKVKVWWPKDQMFYEGVISSFDFVKKKHMVLYNDGDKEVLNLGRERWELVGDDSFVAMGKFIEHPSHDASSDMQRKKKGYAISGSSSKQRKVDGSLKSKSSSSGKPKDVKSGGKSGSKFKDDSKAELKSKSNSKSSEKSVADAVKDKNPSRKHRHKFHGDSAKTSSRGGDNVAKTSSHSKPDCQRIANSKGNTPQSGRGSSVYVTGLGKSSSSKLKETDHIKWKTTDLAKSQESIKWKSPDFVKSQESETKTGRKRRR